jgi:SAM-dependent methyltransferase
VNGVARIVAYNWPRYAAALVVVAAATLRPMPLPVHLAVWLAGAWIAAGLVATWWVYDHKPLYAWRWCTDLLPAPDRYAVVSTGLDEISPTLRALHPRADATLIDLFDPAVTREPSIRRARAMTPQPAGALPATVGALPVPPQQLDAVYLVFAAHELRAPAQRRALFAEIARTLRPGGRLLLVEHCRDRVTIAAYGPGAWHFFPRAEWLRQARGAGLTLTAEATMTPLVHALVFTR